MNFIQTLYYDQLINPLQHQFGWVAPEFHLMSWALSSLQLKKKYGSLDLFCNKTAAVLLIDKLGLPYNNVYTTTHDKLLLPDKGLWALPKIYTYLLQRDPFIHLDGDVFIFDKLPAHLVESRLVSQNAEEASAYHSATKKQIQQFFNHLPPCVINDFERPGTLQTLNAGIIGGNDIEFIQEFSKMALNLVYDNIENLSKINTDAFNVFFEQHLFYSLAKESNIEVTLLFEELVENNDYTGLGDFHEAPCKRNYLHLLGNYKRDEHTCRQMAAKLRQLYPEYYYRIIKLFRDKGLPVMSTVYEGEELDSFSGYQLFTANALEAFKREPLISESIVSGKPLQSLTILQAAIDCITDYSKFEQADIEKDFAIFSSALSLVKEKQSGFESNYLYGRDMDSVSWYCSIFGNDSKIENTVIEQCPTVSIISSGFDWAGILKKQLRVGVRHYEQLEIQPGEFYNLVVPEVFGDEFSLQDMDEMEKLILDHLVVPMTIGALFIEMQAYVEADIVKNHLVEYEELITVMLQQLVLKKAVKPAKHQSN